MTSSVTLRSPLGRLAGPRYHTGHVWGPSVIHDHPQTLMRGTR